ncbi:hypothetical protein COCSUDRAFT_33395 [Coccomyxa subellipsoidea C-169]|uniref:Uncharacterized protein n=1 Tax=Coccomyxa subellipsoidea (strain C-169) TaxID=574566 RepID=I0YWN4_COCSC|nr:hypothetical protein COCSUDRAFT_33395 [Coccomyxa subellipsoidea C-169]EIE22803.1 hypothetical protein COCSUDRAFT_33395 [Coccomyxa subellipsoidea C-169]|eukprot:XP_005647347.1 hypothetical protein COCSUDRAFT_33395 [Coccomyxa subellipsoidea C-169]
MSEPTVAPLDPAKRKTKTFSKQMSKTFQKGKDAMKRGLLTPRGARAQEKSSAEGPVGKSAVATPSIPKAPVPSTDPVSKLNDALPASDPVDTEVDYVKATVKAKEDSSTPATVVVEPVNDAATPELTGPATPAPMPSDKAVPGDKDSLDLVQAEPELVAEKVQPGLVEEKDAPGEELGLEPPNVRVTVMGVPTDDSKAFLGLEANKAVSYKSEKNNRGGGKKAILGAICLVSASAVGFAVKSALAR